MLQNKQKGKTYNLEIVKGPGVGGGGGTDLKKTNDTANIRTRFTK